MDPITLATAIGGVFKEVISAWPKGDKKRLRLATPLADVVEGSLSAHVAMVKEKTDSGEWPKELDMLVFSLEQTRSLADALGDAIRGFDDDVQQ